MSATPLSTSGELRASPGGLIPGAGGSRIGPIAAPAPEQPGRFGGPEVSAPPAEFTAADVSAVYRFVARRVANRADAADIAQQTLLLGCAKRVMHRGGPLSAWLIAIARRLVVDHFRSTNRYQFLDVDALAETDWAPQTPAATYEHRERLTGWLDAVTRRLPLVEQAAVLLADAYACRDRDSAAVLRMSLPSFKLLLHGARARLQSFFVENGARAGNSSKSSAGRTAVTCRLGANELVALRNRLVEGLSL